MSPGSPSPRSSGGSSERSGGWSEASEAPVSDEESEGDLWAAQVGASAQLELRAMRLVSIASLLIAVFSASLLIAHCSLLSSMAFHKAAEERSAGPGMDVIGFSAVRLKPGWHRTYLDSQVFATESLDAPAVQMLPVDSLVYVAEVRQQAVLIVKPVRGWVRPLTEEGVEVMAPDPDETYSADPGSGVTEATSRSRLAREMNEVQQIRSRRLAALQQRIVDARKLLRADAREEQMREKREQLAKQAAKAFRLRASKALARQRQ